MNKKVPICISAANRIINRTHAWNVYRVEELGKPRIELASQRLQKLLYLCALLWYIDHEECNMIPEDFQAWPTGPVIPEIYNYWPVYHDGDLLPLPNTNYILNQEEENLINIVVDNTINLDTGEIINYIFLYDKPWIEAYKNHQGVKSIISKDSIKQYVHKEKSKIYKLKHPE